jgi:hypothetical protein
MTKFEYKEPEFYVVQANTEDVLTASTLDVANDAWDTGAGSNGGGVGFGFTI